MQSQVPAMPEDLGLDAACIQILLKLAEYLPEENGISLASVPFRRINTTAIWQLLAEYIVTTHPGNLLGLMPENTSYYATTYKVAQLLARVHVGEPLLSENWLELANEADFHMNRLANGDLKDAMYVVLLLANGAAEVPPTATYLGHLFNYGIMSPCDIRDVFLEFLKAAPPAETETALQRRTA